MCLEAGAVLQRRLWYGTFTITSRGDAWRAGFSHDIGIRSLPSSSIPTVSVRTYARLSAPVRGCNGSTTRWTWSGLRQQVNLPTWMHFRASHLLRTGRCEWDWLLRSHVGKVISHSFVLWRDCL